MEELDVFDIVDFLRYYFSKIFVVILMLIIAVTLGNLYNMNFKVPQYKSETTIILVSETNQFSQSELTLNKNLVTTYSNIVRSKKVLNKVIKNLNLDYTYGDLYSKVNVSSIDNTEIIKISVVDPDKKKAALIANGIVPIFSAEVKRIYGIENVSVLDKALKSSRPYNIHTVKDNIIFAFIGILLGSIIILTVYCFDSSVKSAEMIENKLGLTVIGMIPKIERRNKYEWKF